MERALRRRVETLVAPETLASCSQPRWLDTLGMLVALWLELLVLLAAANLVSRVSIALAVGPALIIMLLIATRVNALNVVIHEGSHGFLARDRRVNDRLCNAAASWWMLHSVEEYRPSHRLHHLYLHDSRDPDLDQYLFEPGRGRLLWLLVQDLSGITAVRRARSLLKTASDKTDAPSSSALLNQIGKALTQLVLLGQFVLFQGVWRGVALYGIFWLVPVLSLFPVLKRLKAITEHYDPRLRSADSTAWVARTSAAGQLQDRVIGARMEYHFEHHVLPTIPFRGLKRLHLILEQAGFFSLATPDARAAMLSGGYVQFLGHLPVEASSPSPVAPIDSVPSEMAAPAGIRS